MNAVTQERAEERRPNWEIGGEEQQCRRCSEWWPADEEFFRRRRDGSGAIAKTCRACESETWSAWHTRRKTERA